MVHSFADRISSAVRLDGAWIAVLIAAAVPAFLIGPRIAPFVAVASSLLLLLIATRNDVCGSLKCIPAPVLAMLALAAWALLTVSWAADRQTGAGKALLLILFTVAVGSVAATGSKLPNDVVRAICRTVLMAFAIGLAFLCFEEVTGHAIKRTLYILAPLIRPPGKHFGVTWPDGRTDTFLLAPHVTNRSMAALSMTLWPMMLVAWCLNEGKRRWMIAGAILVAAAIAIAKSQHDTSLLALLASLLCVALCWWRPRIAYGLVAAGWVVATLLVVPITDYAYRSMRLHEASWVPHTGRQRIILWGYTAEQVKLHPILGVGTDSTKPLDARRGPQVEQPPGYVYQLRTGPHGHNIYLQNWYELGAVGAILLCAFGLVLLRTISQSAMVVRPFLLGAFVSAAVMAALSWGMWQAWFMGAFAFTATLALLATQLQHRLAIVSGRR